MNRSNAQSRKTFGGYHGEYRPVWSSEYRTVEERDARGRVIGPRLFKTAQEAELEAWRCLRDIEEPVMTATGTMSSRARQTAESIFRKEQA